MKVLLLQLTFYFVIVSGFTNSKNYLRLHIRPHYIHEYPTQQKIPNKDLYEEIFKPKGFTVTWDNKRLEHFLLRKKGLSFFFDLFGPKIL